MGKRYKEIVLEDGVKLVAPKGKRYKLVEIEKGVVKPELVSKKKKKSNVFFKMTTSKIEEVKEWFLNESPKARTRSEMLFFRNLNLAFENINYDYEIATIEPTVIDGKIKYIKDKEVAVGYSYNQWKQMAKEYLPDKGSRLATLYETIMWYAWRIVKGYWTLDSVTNNSSSIGNYADSPNAAHKREKAGVRKSGGFRDGQGNTAKIVSHEHKCYFCGKLYETMEAFCILGGDYLDNGNNPLRTVVSEVISTYTNVSFNDILAFDRPNNSSGIVVLTNNSIN